MFSFANKEGFHADLRSFFVSIGIVIFIMYSSIKEEQNFELIYTEMANNAEIFFKKVNISDFMTHNSSLI